MPELVDDARESPERRHAAAMTSVDVAFIRGYRSVLLDHLLPNEDLASFVADAPDRRVGFAGVDPLEPDALDRMEQAFEAGLAGITIAPADQGCRPTHDRCMQVLESCAERGVPVVVSNPGATRPESVLEFLRPAHFDDIARDLPELRLVLADIGRAFLEEALLMIGKHERVYAEISTLVGRSGLLHNGLVAAHERGVMDKLLFGSGWPDHRPDEAVEKIYGVKAFDSNVPPLPREALRQLIERDAFECLGLESTPAALAVYDAPLTLNAREAR
ncbi:MAG: amidohydrolase family protein [Phycisphaerales bacterium]